jgi:G3E family GTPase
VTKIDIVSGFLGAGKTTLIKKLLEESLKSEKVVLIENEFGEVGIDGGFLKDTGIEITEMNSGCICCTLVGDFAKNLREVMDRFNPDRIIIEPSGVGKLSDVMTSVIDFSKENENTKLNALVTVVNAKTAKKQMKAFGEFFNNQIEYATTIILSRSEEMDQSKLDETVALLKEKNDKALIVTTSLVRLDGAKILSAIEGKENLEVSMKALEAHEADEAEHHHHHHDHDEAEHEHHHDHDEDEHEHHHDHDEDEHEHHHDHDEDEHEHHHDHDEDEHDHHEGEHHHHHADDIFNSIGKETAHVFEKSKIESALKTLSETDEYGNILRSKGMLPTTDGKWAYFDFVAGEYEIREGSPDVTGRIVVIGTDLKEHELFELFGL